jgi:hypothetical protein
MKIAAAGSTTALTTQREKSACRRFSGVDAVV